MPWMQVSVEGHEHAPEETVINTDAIVLFKSSVSGGTYIKFLDGTTLLVLDPMKEIVDVVLRADANKAK